jgi:hypothetical protein
MRTMGSVILGVLTLAVVLTGCSAHGPALESFAPLASADSALLFDPYRGFPSASDVVYRGDWPSTDAVYQGGEQIYYRESIYDIQGLRNNGRDLTFRRFRVERMGSASR